MTSLLRRLFPFTDTFLGKERVVSFHPALESSRPGLEGANLGWDQAKPALELGRLRLGLGLTFL